MRNLFGEDIMKVIIASTEFEGLLKTGGLGDAISGISYALSKLDDFEVYTIIPNYMNVDDSGFEKITEINIDSDLIEGCPEKFKADILYKKSGNLNIYLVDNEYYFNRSEIYGYDDDLLRWTFFSRVIYELIVQKELNPDIVHTNDYHEGLVPFLFKNHRPDDKCKFALSIHNASFQGYYEFASDDEKSLFEQYVGLNWNNDDVNLLKESALNSDRIISVSPDYAEAIQTPDQGNGLENIYKEKGVLGFINGLDTSIHDRESEDFDSYLKVKEKYKLKLQKEFNLKEDKNIPLITYICRLGVQKGSNIVFDSLNNFIEDSQFLLLGTGVEEFEEKFSSLNGKLENYIAVIDFDSDLARELYIASDIFLMPSSFEPCGIAQLIAQHYASLPIVTDVGGLKDTIVDYPSDDANGFKIKEFSSEALSEVILKALDIYSNDNNSWLKLMEKAYNSDNSWDNKIKNYVKLYKEMAE